MVVRKRGLGRGLDALLGGSRPSTDSPAPIAPDPSSEDVAPDGEQLVRLPVEMLRRGRFQPRREIR